MGVCVTKADVDEKGGAAISVGCVTKRLKLMSWVVELNHSF